MPTVFGGYDGYHGIAGLLTRLLALSDATVMSILPIVMGETLAVGGTEVDMLGHLTGTDMRVCWQDALVLPTLIRDKPVLTAVVPELAGTEVAQATAGATATLQRGILHPYPPPNTGR